MRWVISLTLAVSMLYAQEISGPAPESQEKQEQKDYRLGAGDVVAISVFGMKDFDRNIPLSNSGRLHVPYLGVLSVAGMTVTQLQDEIGRRLRERGYIKDPWVQIRVVDHRAQTVYILGEVMMPGQYVLKQDMYMMDLVSLGMGLNEVTSRTVYLYRQKPPALAGEKPSESASLYDVLAIDLQEVFEGKRPELNVRLRGGDILYCPERKPGYFYVLGDLNKPGAVEMPQSEPVLVSRAISWAGGPTRTAKMSKGIVLRYDEAGTRQQLAVNFKAVLAGKQPDFPVKPNDVIFIPGSSTKTLAYGILGVIPGVAQGAALIP
jgi:polysaccharide biosynthesis/export protein